MFEFSRFNLQQLNNAVEQNNKYFRGYFPENQTTVSVQGSIDPWHTLGIGNNNTIGVEGLFVNSK